MYPDYTNPLLDYYPSYTSTLLEEVKQFDYLGLDPMVKIKAAVASMIRPRERQIKLTPSPSLSRTPSAMTSITPTLPSAAHLLRCLIF